MEEAIPKKPVPSNGSSNVRVNVVINLIRTLTLTILSFITFPYVCRILGDSTLGLYTWVNTFVYYFLILAKISIPNIAIRECVKVRDDKKAFSHKVQEFFLLQAFMTILSFGLMVSIMAAVPAFNDQTYMQLGFLLSINFLAGVFSFEWVYIALREAFLYRGAFHHATLALSAILTFVYVTRKAIIPTRIPKGFFSSMLRSRSFRPSSPRSSTVSSCPNTSASRRKGPMISARCLGPSSSFFSSASPSLSITRPMSCSLGFLDSTKVRGWSLFGRGQGHRHHHHGHHEPLRRLHAAGQLLLSKGR
jgi:hypothetical protein